MSDSCRWDYTAVCHAYSEVESANLILSSIFFGGLPVFHIGPVNDVQPIVAITMVGCEHIMVEI